MKKRGMAFIAWSDSCPAAHQHKEILSSGIAFEVGARVCRRGNAQLFVGVYRADGMPIVEEYYPHVVGKNLDEAFQLGINRGRSLVIGRSGELVPTSTRCFKSFASVTAT